MYACDKTRVSCSSISLVRFDVGLIASCTAVIAVGFALTSAGIPVMGSSSPELQDDEPIEMGAPVGVQIPDGLGVHEGRLETEFASAVGQTERASKPLSVSAPCATFDERFYFDQQISSFDERFTSAFGADAAGEGANVGEPATGKPAVAHAVPRPETSRHASILEERLNIAGASLGVSVPFDSDNRTAIYDIAARTVYLPNGNKLEAHSGLGSRLDDPRYVTAKGQGPTPPNIYNLALRERLFHGVRAIRLVPVHDGKMFGRDGILAHSYMLGPSGQSNGCVSFRNYPAFLNAFLKGEVDRIVVVQHLLTTTGAATTGAKAITASGG
jgi:hypothetical protein